MMRTQPPGFRWLVGGFALLAAIVLGWHYRTAGDRGALLFAVLCLLVAGYWLVIDREPADPEPADREPADREPADSEAGE